MSYIQDMKDKEDRMTTDRALSTLCEAHNGVEMSPTMRRHYEYLWELKGRFLGKTERKQAYVNSFTAPVAGANLKKNKKAGFGWYWSELNGGRQYEEETK